ncbi:MAG TPA: hypothetical protein VHS58_09320 [Acetobacteraceae bacterium]|jgi:hypothetical protein|nr:hypothetical protein [Acetobacteraceae bacterium]
MPDEPSPLRPATPDEIADALAFALRFDGRRRFDKGNEMMAKITAKHLVKHLEQAAFVVMKKPPLKGHSIG